MSLPRAVYTAAVRCATPILLAHLARRARRQTGGPDDWRARLGFAVRDARRPLWLHAASAGEMQAAAPLAVALAREQPLRLTSFTATGLARATALLPEVPASLAPIDLPGSWRRFLLRTRPRLALLLETELWPNLFATLQRAGIPLVLASARMTPATARRLARTPATAREMMAAATRVLAQTQADLERFVALGLAPERGRVTGNLKEALVVPPADLARGRALAAGAFADRRVWVAGSLREGEEAAVAEAVAAVRDAVPDAVVVLVPRHPERAREFTSHLEARGIRTLSGAALDDGTALAGGSVVVVARVGVLLALYAAAQVAFVGGTLAPLGGHNVLEPALLGVPVLVGPSLEQVRAAAERLRAAQALTVVNSGSELGAAVSALLRDRAACARRGAAARRAAGTSRALEATLAEIRALL